MERAVGTEPGLGRCRCKARKQPRRKLNRVNTGFLRFLTLCAGNRAKLYILRFVYLFSNAYFQMDVLWIFRAGLYDRAVAFRPTGRTRQQGSSLQALSNPLAYWGSRPPTLSPVVHHCAFGSVECTSLWCCRASGTEASRKTFVIQSDRGRSDRIRLNHGRSRVAFLETRPDSDVPPNRHHLPFIYLSNVL